MENIVKIVFDNAFFNALDTLDCGQIFRFNQYEKGFKVFSLDKCCYVYTDGDSTVIECEETDKEYFFNFFDLSRDYNLIYSSALKEDVCVLSEAAQKGKGIRILNQDKVETLFSFIVSQNNNIPRIKGILEKLCKALGQEKTFMGEKFYAFPTVQKMAEADLDFYKSIGLGYRAEYIKRLADGINRGFDVNSFSKYPTATLKSCLIKIHGVGPKVADCVALFGFHRSDSFPVDTWIEKVYREDFKGSIKDRAKIAQYLADRFKENAGYYQQYLFYFKRLKEKSF